MEAAVIDTKPQGMNKEKRKRAPKICAGHHRAGRRPGILETYIPQFCKPESKLKFFFDAYDVEERVL